jgi:hypothetical protein
LRLRRRAIADGKRSRRNKNGLRAGLGLVSKTGLAVFDSQAARDGKRSEHRLSMRSHAQ